MRRVPLGLSALTLALLTVASPAWGGSPVNYGTGMLGEVRTACFTVCFGSNCSGSGTISSLNVTPPYFVRGVRIGAASHPNLCAASGVTTPATPPVTVPANKKMAFDVDLVATALGQFQSPLRINQETAFDLQGVVVPTQFCSPGPTALCLQDDRFKTRLYWRTQLGTRGPGGVVPGAADDSGLFYFTNPNNWEVLTKVLNGCTINNRYWVFNAATTNVEVTLTVTDTQTQQAKSYFNPRGSPYQPIQDTSAFATCP